MKMMMTILNFKSIALVLSLIFSLAPQNAEAQTLTSYLRGETRNGHYLKLKHAGPAMWTLSDFTPCAKYPCDVNSQTTNTTLSAHWISSRTMADGNTVIGLSNGMIVTFINNGMVPPNPDGTRVESYWQLEIPATDGGKPEVVRLFFAPMIE